MSSKKLFAFFAAIVILVACLPGAVFAAEAEESQAPQADVTAVQADAVAQPNPKYPDVVPIVMDVEQISYSSGYGSSMAMDADGNVYSWGYNYYGTIGNGKIRDGYYSITPVELPGPAMQVAAGREVSAVLLEDGRVFDWGDSCSTRLTSISDYTPYLAPNVTGATYISAYSNVFAITEQGITMSWGLDHYSLGRTIISTNKQRVPESVNLPHTGISDVTLSYQIGFAVTETGGLYSWGRQNASTSPLGVKLGYVPTATKLNGIRQVTGTAASLYFVTEDNRLQVWGSNPYGAFGLGHMDAVDQLTTAAEDVVKVGTNNLSSFILKTDGTVWAAGSNRYCLGLEIEDRDYVTTEYTQVEGIENVVDLVAGIDGYGVYAQTEDGSWWTWGINASGRFAPAPGSYYQYLDSPVLIFASSEYAGVEPETHQITVTETWADGAEADVVTPYIVREGEAFSASFATPEGYEAEVTSDAAISVDYAAGTIDIDAVSGDVGVTITYTPEDEPDPGERYNITVIVRYDDGAFSDEVTTYSVAEGDEFFEPYTVQPGYEYDSFSLYSLTYRVDPRGQTVYISEVWQDITVELEYKRAAYNVTITSRYEDGALPDDVQVYLANKGQPFEANYERLDGYLVDNVESNVLGVSVRGDGTISIRAVNSEVFITITLYKE